MSVYLLAIVAFTLALCVLVLAPLVLSAVHYPTHH